ncbi:MAG: Rv3235 family protein [Aeromicrobium sp.]
MKAATALQVRPASFLHDSRELTLGQIPLPFPDASPVVPAPIERDNLAGRTVLRQKAGHFMQALVEVLAGERPPRQLAAWMSHDVYGQMVTRLAIRPRPAHRPTTLHRARVVSVHVAMVDAETAEIAARFVQRGRSRAIAVRLELRTNHRSISQWLCTAIAWG